MIQFGSGIQSTHADLRSPHDGASAACDGPATTILEPDEIHACWEISRPPHDRAPGAIDGVTLDDPPADVEDRERGGRFRTACKFHYGLSATREHELGTTSRRESAG